jgi:hypothetical protein
MKIYKKNTLVYKVRAWVIVCTGSIQTLNYIALGLKTRGENIFRSMCILACFTCLFTISEIRDEFQKGKGDATLTETSLYLVSIGYIGYCFSPFWAVIVGGIETIILLLGIVAILQKQKNINDGKRKPNRKK